MNATARAHTSPSLDQLQAQFLDLLPRIETHARICFRFIPCPHRRADQVAETVALAWQCYLRLVEKGKDINHFVMTFACTVARSVQCGRRLAGMARSKDIMNPQAQQRFGFKVETLPQATRLRHESLYGRVNGQKQHDAFEERLQDNRITPVAEQAAFRIDFPQWRHTLSHRNRAIIDRMLLDERTLDLSRKFGISPGRVSQLRQQFHSDWLRFHGERDQAATPLA